MMQLACVVNVQSEADTVADEESSKQTIETVVGEQHDRVLLCMLHVTCYTCLLSVRRPSIHCVSFDEYAAHSILSRQRRLSMLS